MSYCLNPNCPRPNSNSVSVKFCTGCGAKLLLAERYRATKQIGQGGFGKTFLAIDEYKPSQPRCVIKQFLLQAQGTNNIEKATELFKVEAVQLDKLGRNHPQIPELLAYFTQDNQQYLVQEFIDGQNLADELKKNGAFNEDQIIALLNNLLPVLQFVHSKQVIHRDIKPENIIRHSDGELVLVDFGAAKAVTRTALSVTGTVIGTAGYASPEQAMGKASFASDIYSLGVTCLHLLTTIEPFDLFDITEGEWVFRDYLPTPVSNNLASVLDKMVAGAVKRRYQSVIEVMQALDFTNTKTPPIVITRTQSTAPTVPALDADAYYNRGRSYYNKKDYDRAIAEYNQALRLDPNYVYAYNNRGLVYYNLKDYDRAIADYNQALKLDPHYTAAYNNRELAYKDKKDYAQALKLDPNKAINPLQFAVPTVCVSVPDNLSSDAGVDYTRLRDLLATGNWQDADNETRLVIFKVVGRYKGEGDVIREELLSFPCTDLRTIDSLWVKYSSGRFGFSVQKKIYLEVGGILDGKYHEETWNKFGDRVGRRSCTLNTHLVLQKHRGHLPSTICGNAELAACLFSRIQACIAPTIINPPKSAVPSVTVSVPDNLRSDVGVVYTRLRDLLAAGNWKDADYETYLVMLKVVSCKQDDWICGEKLSNFPCTSLRTINSLWVEYSNGRFGFSVQKKIYLEVGGSLVNNFPETAYKEVWEKFGDHVEWRKGWWGLKEWSSYGRATFDTSAPVGYLPFLPQQFWDISLCTGLGNWVRHRRDMRGQWWDRRQRWSLLFARIETCSSLKRW